MTIKTELFTTSFCSTATLNERMKHLNYVSGFRALTLLKLVMLYCPVMLKENMQMKYIQSIRMTHFRTRESHLYTL